MVSVASCKQTHGQDSNQTDGSQQESSRVEWSDSSRWRSSKDVSQKRKQWEDAEVE